MNTSSPIGHEFTITIFGVDKQLLNDSKRLKKILEDSASSDNYKILYSISHNFEKQGASAMVLISESHLCVHTYPEYNCLVFNFYTCRGENEGTKCVEYLRKNIKHKRFIIDDRKIIVNEKLLKSK